MTPSRRRQPRARHRSWLALLLLAVLVRAAIPAGYMPDPQAMSQGRLALMLCGFGFAAPASGVRGGMPMAHAGAGSHTAGGHHGDHSHHGHADAGHGHGHASAAHAHAGGHDDDAPAHLGDCPFGLVMAHGAAVPPDASPASMMVAAPAVSRSLPAWRAAEALPPLPALGPPLGSRAPPRFLG